MATAAPLAFLLRVLCCLQPWAMGYQAFCFYFFVLVVVLRLLRLDVKWLLIRHYIESKNPREDQHGINHCFGVGLRGHLLNEQTMAEINHNHITHVGDIQKPALTYLDLQSWTNKKICCSSNCRYNWVWRLKPMTWLEQATHALRKRPRAQSLQRVSCQALTSCSHWIATVLQTSAVPCNPSPKRVQGSRPATKPSACLSTLQLGWALLVLRWLPHRNPLFLQK